MTFTPKQVEYLLWPINPGRVKQLQGFSHLEAWDVRAHLNRVFGFGSWSVQTNVEIVYCEERAGKDGQPKWNVGAKAWARLTINSTDGDTVWYEDVASDESIHPNRGEAMDNAVKSAASGALKRCAVNLGDQFGLSLYRNGSLAPVVITVTPWDRGTTILSVQDEDAGEPEPTSGAENPHTGQHNQDSGAFK